MKSKTLIVISLIILIAVVDVFGRYAVRGTSKYLREMEKLDDHLSESDEAEIQNVRSTAAESQESGYSRASRIGTVSSSGGGGISTPAPARRTSNRRARLTSASSGRSAPMPESSAPSEAAQAENQSESASAETAEAAAETDFFSAGEPESTEGYEEDTFDYADDTGESSGDDIETNISNRVDGLIADNEDFSEEDKPIIMDYLAIQMAESPEDFENISDDELTQRMNYIVLMESLR